MTDYLEKAPAVGVLQGEFKVTHKTDVVFSTILGSCISACLYDIKEGVGGMNHFLLAAGSVEDQSSRYGINAMELLVNGILKLGGTRSNLRAKIFGGGNMLPNLPDVGAENTNFVQRYLTEEGIECVSSSVGGNKARRIRFHPASGRVKQVFVTSHQYPAIDEENRKAAQPQKSQLLLF